MSSVKTCDCINHGMRSVEEPEGYLERAEWAAKMQRKHIQRKCLKCGLYTIWTLKRVLGSAPASGP
jgi:hypothetical protein